MRSMNTNSKKIIHHHKVVESGHPSSLPHSLKLRCLGKLRRTSNVKLISSILISFFVLFSSLFAQNDAKIINDHFFNTPEYNKKFENRKITTKLEKGDKKTPFVANLFMEAVYVYKDIISPQDMDVCTFHPSCSEYAFLCLKHQSFPEAVLNTGDRLMRCYSANYIYYIRDDITGLSEDYPDTTK